MNRLFERLICCLLLTLAVYVICLAYVPDNNIEAIKLEPTPVLGNKSSKYNPPTQENYVTQHIIVKAKDGVELKITLNVPEDNPEALAGGSGAVSYVAGRMTSKEIFASIDIFKREVNRWSPCNFVAVTYSSCCPSFSLKYVPRASP